ncbi:hypothetical protein DL767_006630 [Monosporascus sp. MG133]|nr:hypothetical protein DL767_006630 [Monosporascus sp. MG133]
MLVSRSFSQERSGPSYSDHILKIKPPALKRSTGEGGSQLSAAGSKKRHGEASSALNHVSSQSSSFRPPVSAEEDALNKPWRPGPRGRITARQIRATRASSSANAIIAIAFRVYNTGPVKVAVGPETTRDGTLFLGLTTRGVLWAAIVSAVIFTTMQVQDLQDSEAIGPGAVGRRA